MIKGNDTRHPHLSLLCKLLLSYQQILESRGISFLQLLNLTPKEYYLKSLECSVEHFWAAEEYINFLNKQKQHVDASLFVQLFTKFRQDIRNASVDDARKLFSRSSSIW